MTGNETEAADLETALLDEAMRTVRYTRLHREADRRGAVRAFADVDRGITALRQQLAQAMTELADAEADRDALSEGVVRLVLLSELCECPDMVDGGTPLPDCPTHGDPDLFVARVRYLREVERLAREVRRTLGSPDEHLTAVQRLGILLDGGA